MLELFRFDSGEYVLLDYDECRAIAGLMPIQLYMVRLGIPASGIAEAISELDDAFVDSCLSVSLGAY